MINNTNIQVLTTRIVKTFYRQAFNQFTSNRSDRMAVPESVSTVPLPLIAVRMDVASLDGSDSSQSCTAVPGWYAQPSFSFPNPDITRKTTNFHLRSLSFQNLWSLLPLLLCHLLQLLSVRLTPVHNKFFQPLKCRFPVLPHIQYLNYQISILSGW